MLVFLCLRLEMICKDVSNFVLKCLLSTADMEAKKSEDAAIKIQSSYRGFAARKEVEAMKAANSQDTVKSKGIIIHSIQFIASESFNSVQLSLVHHSFISFYFNILHRQMPLREL